MGEARNTGWRTGPRQGGFTLLEILVVVSLIALLSLAVLTVPVWTDDSRKLETAATRLTDTLTMLSEQSLFSGKLLALRLTDSGWTPLQYDPGEREFVPADGEGLGARSLPTGLELTWELDQLSQDTARHVTLNEAAREMVNESPFSGEGLLDDDKEKPQRQDEEEEPGLPQVYFFPSGECTPVTITLRAIDDLDMNVKRQLTALGTVRDPRKENKEETHSGPVRQSGDGEGSELFGDDFLGGDEQ